jgi:hypothetical protein
MRRIDLLALVTTMVLAGPAVPASAQVTAYEGARLIAGDGRVIDKGTLVVDRLRGAAVDRSQYPR